VRAEAVQRRLGLTADLAWQLVAGSRLRAAVADLDDDELDAVRERYLSSVAEQGIASVDATTLIAVGRRPE
jgi:hypothetical protein